MSRDVLVDETSIPLLSESGDQFVLEGFVPPIPETYDFIAAIEAAAPGVIIQRADIDAVSQAYYAAGMIPLTEAEIVALVGPLPSYPTGLPRFPDSYGGMEAPDGWNLTTIGQVVNP